MMNCDGWRKLWWVGGVRIRVACAREVSFVDNTRKATTKGKNNSRSLRDDKPKSTGDNGKAG
jgi:hypothetical protein